MPKRSSRGASGNELRPVSLLTASQSQTFEARLRPVETGTEGQVCTAYLPAEASLGYRDVVSIH